MCGMTGYEDAQLRAFRAIAENTDRIATQLSHMNKILYEKQIPMLEEINKSLREFTQIYVEHQS